ncbi:hypothetical protein F4801DRAFT_568078 [Xylaria longipes]|nr:hypothetical protein F4801DRAFT_568078 [Xylaria longipes]
MLSPQVRCYLYYIAIFVIITTYKSLKDLAIFKPLTHPNITGLLGSYTYNGSHNLLSVGRRGQSCRALGCIKT